MLNFLPPAPIDDLQPVFWLETLAGVAFGAAWLIKGETLLKDVVDVRTASVNRPVNPVSPTS